MDNMSTWDALANIDPKYTKPITGKPYKGTSPNPHYIVKMLTEHFGRVGEGWGVRVVSEGFQPLGDEVLHWCRIEMWHTARENTFEAYGQTKAVMKTRNGMMTDEDAPKKSFTDAMTKAASYIGAAANIFLGRYDDSKYVEQVNQAFREAERPVVPSEVLEAISGAMDMPSLQMVWKANHDWQSHPDFAAAKDKRKNELMKEAA